MHTVQQKLFAWHKLYKELQTTQGRLRSADLRERVAIEAEVQRLQRDSDSALAQVQALLARRRSPLRVAESPARQDCATR